MNILVIVGAIVGAALATLPRIIERWRSPVMRGPEFLFDVAVNPDFHNGAGNDILRRYRGRLFIPYLLEGLIFVALWLAGQWTIANILTAIAVIAIFTRFNYYAARIWAENQARRFERLEETRPASSLVFSLEPRTLLNYTNWHVEGGIILALAAAAMWLASLNPTSHDALMIRKLADNLIVTIYMQVGMLLIKRGIVHSGSAAPADNPEAYLAWRESLRRFSIGVCDVFRLMFALSPIFTIAFILGSARVQMAATAGFIAFMVIAVVYEWRSRFAYLRVARSTKPARLPLLPGAEKSRGPLGFWPALPVLLLKTTNGYALNLASAPVPIAGLYLAGFAVLWFWLVR